MRSYQVLKQAYRTIRQRESGRSLLFGSNAFQMPEKLKTLFLPKDDKNIIRSFHLYYPLLLTHYKASWMKFSKYEGPIQYPGRPIPKEVFETLSEPIISQIKDSNIPMSKIVLRKIIADAIKASNNATCPIHCGEFGCFKLVPAKTRYLWYRDVVDCLEEAGIPWSSWDWKGNFGILDETTWKSSGINTAMGLKNPSWIRLRRPGSSFRNKVRRLLRRIVRKMGL